jgi:hypothetical protein
MRRQGNRPQLFSALSQRFGNVGTVGQMALALTTKFDSMGAYLALVRNGHRRRYGHGLSTLVLSGRHRAWLAAIGRTFAAVIAVGLSNRMIAHLERDCARPQAPSFPNWQSSPRRARRVPSTSSRCASHSSQKAQDFLRCGVASMNSRRSTTRSSNPGVARRLQREEARACLRRESCGSH